MFVTFLRAIKSAFKDFGRNIWLSFIAISILGLALFSFNFLVGLNFLSDSAIKAVENKIDVSVYFTPEAPESQIFELKANLESMEGVKQTAYISREEALNKFKERHQNDTEILKSLDELKDNPLGATLVVKARSSQDYQEILELIERPRYEEIIQDKNFEEHKLVVSRITGISGRVQTVGLGVSFIFTFIAILVVFNTIRVIIYTHKDEIKVMKLVGATNGFIRLPYLIQGLLFSLLGLGLILMVWYPLLSLVQPYVNTFFGDSSVSPLAYFNQNFLYIYGIQFGAAMFLNIVGSWLAVSRYLKV